MRHTVLVKTGSRLGGVGYRVAQSLMGLGYEVRTTVLGHLQRGGTPTYRDRLYGSVFGAKAVELVRAGRWGHMVALRGTEVVAVPLEATGGGPRLVDPDDPMVHHARAIGICMGDRPEFARRPA